MVGGLCLLGGAVPGFCLSMPIDKPDGHVSTYMVENIKDTQTCPKQKIDFFKIVEFRINVICVPRFVFQYLRCRLYFFLGEY